MKLFEVSYVNGRIALTWGNDTWFVTHEIYNNKQKLERFIKDINSEY